jgi:diphthamide synthase (EF-2-diphthine--ammonia ligase)
MKTVNSISGGKTSSYLAKHYPADINIFSLVRIEDTNNLWMKGKDEKTRQLVSDKLGKEFVGTAEMDEIIYTILV